QPDDGVSYAGKITTADARVDLGAPALAVDRHIRSVTPDPGAWLESRWGRMHLGPVSPARDAELPGAPAAAGRALAPGELAVGKRAVWVGTGSLPVRMSTVRPPGKNTMQAADWARGVRLVS